MATVHQTDEALLRSDDLEDFGRFYDRYVKALLAFFQRRVHDPEIAADLTAETFAAAMVSRGRYQPRSATAAAWLFGIAQHKLADYRRRGAAEHRMRARLGMEPVAGGVEDVEAYQHLAVVLDDRILSLPYVSFRDAPDGIDGSGGMQVSGDLTPQTARVLAAILDTGPLPAALSGP